MDTIIESIFGNEAFVDDAPLVEEQIIIENVSEIEDKIYIKELLERKLEYEFNNGYESEFTYTHDKKISKKNVLCYAVFLLLYYFHLYFVIFIGKI